MKTVQERLAFFDEHWSAMKDAVERGGAAAVLHLIRSFRDDFERRTLYRLARRGLVMQDWEGKSLDPYLTVARAGIDEMVAKAEAAGDDGAAILNEANAMSYDLAADLADCWPGDDLPRTRAHFEAGLRAGQDCVRWREELDKPHASRSLGHWAEGIHRLLLGDARGAAASMQRSLDEASAAAEGAADVAGDFAVILASGYLGLAERLAGEALAGARYDEAVARFTAQLEDESKADDARFGIDQLEKVRARVLA